MEKGTSGSTPTCPCARRGRASCGRGTELKNMNSFTFAVARGIDAEVERQIGVWGWAAR